MTAFNPPLYDFPNLDFNPTIFEQGTSAFTSSSGGGGVDLLPLNNTWTGTNNFVLGVITSLLDTLTAETLSIGTAVANAISIGRVGFMTNILGSATIDEDLNVQGSIICNNTVSGSEFLADFVDSAISVNPLAIGTIASNSVTIGTASVPTNVKGVLTVGTTNTIALNATGGLNRILLSGTAGTNGQVLTSGGTGASLSWTTVSGGGGASSYYTKMTMKNAGFLKLRNKNKLRFFVVGLDRCCWAKIVNRYRGFASNVP